MSLYDIVNTVYETLKESDSLSDVYIIKAFPFADKPSRLDRAVIAVSSGEVEASAASIGSGEQHGTAKVRTDIYVPVAAQNNDITEIAKRVISAVSCLFPCGVYLSPSAADDRLNCIYVNCSFTFDYYSGDTEE